MGNDMKCLWGGSGVKCLPGGTTVRGHIPPLPLQEQEQTGFLGREQTLPGPSWCQEQGVLGFSPHICATQTLDQPQTLRVHASPGTAADTWQLERRITQRGYGCH